jgi:methylenetetrahydrofolate dehydrogenase (NADP+)/methenyltetrahydrofolate cyclohydrolase
VAKLIDGKLIAKAVRDEVRLGVQAFLAERGRRPGLHVVLAGDDSASAVYVRNKEKAAEEVGMAGAVHRLPASVTEAELLGLVQRLNADPAVDGILVQLPLPKGIAAEKILDAIDPTKDVDGFHPINVGALWTGKPGLVPCTPRGCMRLLAEAGVALAGARAVVIGRSNIVGKPMAMMLLAANATVTICHSGTADLGAMTRQADIVVAAVGKRDVLTADRVKPGAVVIDVGMNRNDEGKLCGDVDFAGVKEVAGWITPVPGGVGPMTITMLLVNTLTAAARH